MSVPAATSKYGFFSDSLPVVWQYKPKITSSWINNSSNTVMAYSNRPAPIKGHPPIPTNYYRKLARLIDGGAVKFENNLYNVKGPSSIHSRGLTLNSAPLGSSYSSATVVVPSWMTDEVIQGCIEDLDDLRANLLEDIGQATQTLDEMAKLFDLIVDLTELFFHGKTKLWKRRMRRRRRDDGGPVNDLGNGWLAFAYGISPIISSMSALSETFSDRRRTLTVSRSVKYPVNPNNFVGTNCALNSQITGNASQGALCSLTVGLDISSDLSMKRSLGIEGSAKDIAATLWALIPYSFVVDWLIPIERFLRTRSLSSGIAFQYGHVGKKLLCSAEVKVLDAFTGTGDSGELPRGRVEALQYQRIAYNSFLPPSGLSFRTVLRSNQAISAAALLVTRR